MSISPVHALSATRAAIGASAWLMPNTACRLFGLDVSADKSAPFFLKMAGTRDFALAAAPLLAAPQHRRAALVTGLVVDASDIAAIGINHRDRRMSTLSATLFGAASLACIGLGVKALGSKA